MRASLPVQFQHLRSLRDSVMQGNFLCVLKPGWLTAYSPSSSPALHQQCAPDSLLTADSRLPGSSREPPPSSPPSFLTHPPSTLSRAEKGISPLGSHFLLFTSLKDHLFLSRAQIFTESLPQLGLVPAGMVRKHSPSPGGAHILVEEKVTIMHIK